MALTIGLKIAKFKRVLRNLVAAGRVIVDDGPGGRLLVLAEKIESTHGRRDEDTVKKVIDLFDKSNLVVPDAQVNRLIQLFFSSGVNPLLVGDPTKNRFFANPFNRDGARRLIVSYGAPSVEEAIEKMVKRSGDKFRPVVKSLWSLYQKWDNVQRFLDSDWRAPKEKIAIIK